MKSREQEYKEIFIAEALEYFDALNRHLSNLEKTPEDDQILAEIFRLLHNLKANAKAIGFLPISDLSHKLETAFELIRKHELAFSNEVATVLFDGIDLLGEQLSNVDSGDFKISDENIIRNLDIIINPNPNIDAPEVIKISKASDRNISLSDLIYIQIKKLDHLLNLVGELIIDRDRIISLSKDLNSEDLKAVSSHLYRITEEIQFSVMDARLVNVGSLFNKFPRIVRDVAQAEHKEVQLELIGQDIQIDRNILQIITDSLLHLVRNAISHGIEKVPDRLKKNKAPQGTLTLSAQSDRDNVLIRLSDDGKGIDVPAVKKAIVARKFLPRDAVDSLKEAEVLSYLFEPGFSMAKEITEFSGRGVGLDVVKNAIDSIGGRIQVHSEKDKGTTFTLHLPTSIAVKGALLFEVEGGYYGILLMHTDSVVSLEKDELHEVGDMLVATIKDESVPVVYLRDFLNNDTGKMPPGSKNRLIGSVQNIIVIIYNNRRMGLIVDKLYRQQDIVIKPLNKPVDNIDIYGGVTLLGTGKVCLVLDVPAIIRYFVVKK